MPFPLRTSLEAFHMIVIPAKRISGHGLASGCVAKQLPLIEPEFPEIAGCHRGTINVSLAFPLIVVTPDHRTGPITWDYNGSPVEEVFDLVRIEFEAPRGTASIPAWLYISHLTVHRQTPCIHEILAPMINIPDQCDCFVHINREGAQLPYRHWPAVVIL
jgi:hypothetical protein